MQDQVNAALTHERLVARMSGFFGGLAWSGSDCSSVWAWRLERV
jgi:hypothetical protein